MSAPAPTVTVPPRSVELVDSYVPPLPGQIVEPGLKSSAKPLVNTRPPAVRLHRPGEAERRDVAELEVVPSGRSKQAGVRRAVPVVVVAGGLEDERAAVRSQQLRVVDDPRRNRPDALNAAGGVVR